MSRAPKINVLRLRRTISESRDSWMHLCHDNTVVIVNQRNGHASKGEVRLTLMEFEKFKSFYERAKKLQRKGLK